LTATNFASAPNLKNRTVSVHFKDMATHATIHHGHNISNPQARKNLPWQGELILSGKSFWSEHHLVVPDQ
jgi:hypothetical protein